jgi:hypothetical protein
VSISQAQVCGTPPATYLPMTVSDGLAATQGSLPMQVSCP